MAFSIIITQKKHRSKKLSDQGATEITVKFRGDPKGIKLPQILEMIGEGLACIADMITPDTEQPTTNNEQP